MIATLNNNAIFKEYKADIYLLVLSIISFSGWALENEYISVPFFVAIIWYVVIKLNPIYLLPVPLFTIPIFSALLKDVGKIGNADSVVNPAMLFMIIGGVSAIIYDVIKHKRLQQKGTLFYAYLMVLLCMVISLINTPTLAHSITGIAIYGFMLFFYVYFLNCAKGLAIEKIFYAKTILWFSILSSVMTLWVIAYDKTIIDNILKKDINIGWSISNNIATYLVFAVPLILYLSINAANKFIYYYMVILIALVTFLTGSRAGVGGLLILIVPCIIYTFTKTERKDFAKHVLIAIALLLPFISIAFYLNIPEALYKRLFLQKFFFHYNDRKQLLDIAWSAFKLHPFIGTGIFSAGHYIALGGRKVFSYHNVFFETISTIGVVGSLAFSFCSLKALKLIVTPLTTFKIFGVIAIVGSSVFSMFDTAYANPIYLYMVFSFFAFIEHEA